MGLIARLQQIQSGRPQRALSLPWGDPFGDPYFNLGGHLYPLGLNQTMPGAKREDIDGSFVSFTTLAYRANSVVFACLDAHRRLFTEARFQFRRMQNGIPGDLFGTADLGILEVPWPNGTTGDLLARMITYADLAGNFYAARRGDHLAVMRPDWVSIILDAPAGDLDAQIAGYVYHPGGRRDDKGVVLLPEEVAHFAPIADPVARYRGMSPLTPLVREIMADGAATDHKLRFFENGATPNLVVKRADELDKTVFREWVRQMEEGHAGVANAYKTLYLSGGADATVVGANLRQMEFKVTQGAGETRIAAALGIPPIIVGLSEGLAAATYSNYGQARRAYADLWARPTWRNAAASLAPIIRVPGGAELWYDDRNIPFLQEDQKDAADIMQVRMVTAEAGIRSGWKADDVIKAVAAMDINLLLGKHTGLFSVQLQAPGSTKMPVGEAPGETPVGGGTAPETPPKGAVKPVGPAGTPSNPVNGKRDGFEDLLAASETRVYRAIERLTPAQPPTLHFDAGAFQTNITLPEQAAPVVNVTMPEQAPPQVNFAEGAFRTEAGDVTVNVPEQAPPNVTVEAPPAPEVTVTVEAPPAPEVNVTVEAAPAPDITVNVPEPRSVTKTISRNAKGEIDRIVETPDG